MRRFSAWVRTRTCSCSAWAGRFCWRCAAAALSASVGVIVGLPAMRVKGIYLAIATQAFGFIVEEVFARWEHVTGGNAGKSVPGVVMFGFDIGSGAGFYYLCLVLCVLVTFGVPEPVALGHRPRLHRDPRFGDLGAEHGHPHRAVQDAVVRDLGRAHRPGRRAVRAQAAVHLARPVRRAAVDRAAAAGGGRRPGFGARRLPRRDLPDRDAAGDRREQGLPAAGDRPGQRPARLDLRRGAGRHRAVRAAGPVRPLVQDAHLLAAVPVLPRGMFRRQKAFTKSERLR